MAENTKVEWADATWNPITGCSPLSEGCDRCYAARIARTRLPGRFGYPADEPFRVTFHPDKLEQPLRWRKPRRIFVCSMGDLFHPQVRTKHRAAVLKVIDEADHHTYMLLTKRPENLPARWPWMKMDNPFDPWYPKHVWVGVTVESRRWLKRIDDLLKVPAAVRFVSCEPCLSIMTFPLQKCNSCGECQPDGLRCCACGRHSFASPALDWLIIGPETGPDRRDCKPEWIKSLIEQADAAGVPVFVKAFPIDGRLSKDMAEWPKWARRREFPVAAEATGEKQST